MPAVLITGGHGGVGLSCVQHLARAENLEIILAGRSAERMAVVAAQLSSDYGVRALTLNLDVSSLHSVREAAARCVAMLKSREIDGLQAILCNAGGRFGKVDYTEDGFERTFATNVLGHFVLVNALIDRVAANGRIVFTASGTHDPDTVDGKLVGRALEPDAIALAKMGKDGRDAASAGKRYATSKLCMIMLGYELARRLEQRGSEIASISYDPGSVPETGLGREFPELVQRLSRSSFAVWLSRTLGVTQGSLPFSGEALARLATGPLYARSSGKYFQSNDGRLLEVRSSAMSYDQERAAKLWSDMASLTGV